MKKLLYICIISPSHNVNKNYVMEENTDSHVKYLVKRTLQNVVFCEESNKFRKSFALKLAENGGKVLEAYESTYKKINKVRASTLLEEPEVMQYYFECLKQKKDKNEKEEEFIKKYDEFIENFEFNPFETFIYYVEIHPNIKEPVAQIISSDQVSNFYILCFLYDFFEFIDRDFYKNKIRNRIVTIIEKIKEEAIRKPDILLQYNKKVKYLHKNNIDIKDIIGLTE